MNIMTLLTGVVVLLWIAVAVALGVVVLRFSRGQRIGNGITMIAVPFVLALLLTFVNLGLVFVQPDERGVVVSAVAPKGYRDQALMPGLH